MQPGVEPASQRGRGLGGQRSNSAIIHLMLSHSQSRRPDGTHSFIPAHSSSNIRDIHEPVSQSASHPRSIPFPILPTFSGPDRQSPPVSQPVWPVRIRVSTHPPPTTTPYPAKKQPTQHSSGVLPPFSRLPISQLPSSHPPQPQALLRSILEHFLARKPDLEALCFNSLRCAANFAIPLFNNNCIPHSYHSGCLSASHLSSLSPVTALTQSKARRKARQTHGEACCPARICSAQLGSAQLCLRHGCCCTLQTLPPRPLSRRGHPRPRGPLSCTLPSCPACTTALRRPAPRKGALAVIPEETEASPHSLALPICSCRPLELWKRNVLWVSRKPNQNQTAHSHPPALSRPS